MERCGCRSRAEINIIDNVFQPQDAERVFRGFAASGHQLVFGTSFSHTVPIARVAPQFPGTAFDCCSGSKILANLGGFEARYHEGTFLAGIAAAKTTRTGKLGFVGGFPIPDIVGPANAYLLGAQGVNPGISVKAAMTSQPCAGETDVRSINWLAAGMQGRLKG
jgi:basic membrane protein A